MKLFLLFFLPMLSSADLDENGNVVLRKNQFVCQGELGQLDFALNLSTFTIEFTETSAFGRAEIQKNVPFGMKIDYQERSTEVSFSYHWYYTAEYTLTLPPVSDWDSGKGSVVLNGDDADGIWFTDQKFTCAIK